MTYVRSLRLFVMMLGSAIVLLGNNLTLNSPLIGIPGSLAYLVVGGYALRGVFRRKHSVVNVSLGVLLLVVLVGLVSWVFTISYKLGPVEVFVSLCLTALFILLVTRFTHNQRSEAERGEEHSKTFVRFLELIFIVLTVLQFLLLLYSRTGVPMTVWTTLNPLFMPIFFFSVVVLIMILISGEKWQITLLLILTQSILSHMFFVVIFDAGYGKDQWEALGWSRRVFDESDYPRDVPFNLNAYLPGKGLNYKMLKALGSAFYPTLSTVLSRMFSIDVYLGHLLLVPLFWGIFLPIIAYGVTEAITQRPKLATLSALITLAAPSLILWGAVSVSNSLSFLLFFLVIFFLTDYLCSDRTVFWATLTSFATLLAHLLPGVIAFALLILAFGFKHRLGIKSKNVRIVFLAFIFIIGLGSLPFALSSGGLSYPALTGAKFSLERLQGLSTLDAAMLLLFGAYSQLTLNNAIIIALLPLLGLLGVIYVNITGNNLVRNRELSRFFLFAIVMIMIDYRIVEIFMFDVPFGAQRILVFNDILSIPFASILMLKIAEYVPSNLIVKKVGSKRLLNVRFAGATWRAVTVLCLSALITMSISLGYTVSNPPTSAARAYLTSNEVEAARFIDSSTNESYVVVCYGLFKLAGYAVVGVNNPRAYYSGIYDYGWMAALFSKVRAGMAIGMIEASTVNNSTTGFFVISTIRFNGADAVIASLEERPDFQLYGVFGDEVYVFKYRVPTSRFVEGIGPGVYVSSLQSYVNTTYALDVGLYQATYRIELSGSDNYNLSAWPVYWSFESIAPNPIIKNIDANLWINFTGDSSVKYVVSWTASVLYSVVGWKDDSFLANWSLKGTGGFEKSPAVFGDGDILTIRGSFEQGFREYYWLKASVGLSTNSYPYALLKWKSTSTCAISWVYYRDGSSEPILSYGSYSSDWATTIVRLAKDKVVDTITIGLDDFTDDVQGEQFAYFDFIMVAKTMETP